MFSTHYVLGIQWEKVEIDLITCWGEDEIVLLFTAHLGLHHILTALPNWSNPG